MRKLIRNIQWMNCLEFLIVIALNSQMIFYLFKHLTECCYGIAPYMTIVEVVASMLWVLLNSHFWDLVESNESK